MRAVLVIAIILWFIFGDPTKTTANIVWPDDAAPWEDVDAFYYPNRQDLTEHRSRMNVGSRAGCLAAVRSMASEANDIALINGDYECGVGRMGSASTGLNVYRLTVK